MRVYPGESDPRPLRERVAWGVRQGLFYAAVLSLLAAIPLLIGAVFLVGALATGELSFGQPWPLEMRAVAWALPIYVAGGVTGGAIVGALFELTRWWVGRRVVRMLACLPGSFLLGALVLGFRDWGAEQTGFCVAFAVVWGGAMSFVPEEGARRFWRLQRATRPMHRR